MHRFYSPCNCCFVSLQLFNHVNYASCWHFLSCEVVLCTCPARSLTILSIEALTVKILQAGRPTSRHTPDQKEGCPQKLGKGLLDQYCWNDFDFAWLASNSGASSSQNPYKCNSQSFFIRRSRLLQSGLSSGCLPSPGEHFLH